tara:strand:- start:3425 stop:4738 length:1314 start_codon:yes stop_codon:yes gene_type:complete
MDKKRFITYSFSSLILFLFVGIVSAATVTIHFPLAGSIQNVNLNGVDGGNITINASVEIDGGDLNITMVNFSYRLNSASDWILISYDSLSGNDTDMINGGNSTNLTSNAGNHTYSFPWNITGLADKSTYELNASAYNDTVLVGSTVVTGIIIDKTNPTSKLEILDPVTNKEKTKFFFNDKVLLKCTRSDATSGFNQTNVSLMIPESSTIDFVEKSTATRASTEVAYEVTFTDTNVLGDYIVYCGVTDKGGSLNGTTNATFSILTKPPQGSTRPKGFVNPVGKKIISGTTDLGRLAEKAISVQMRKTAVVKMDIQGTTYDFTIKELSEESVTLMAGPAEVTMKKGESAEADLNGDNTNDVMMTFHKQFKKGRSATADITFAAITTPVKAPGADSDTDADVKKDTAGKGASSAGSFLVTIIVIIVIIVVGYFLIKGKKK